MSEFCFFYRFRHNFISLTNLLRSRPGFYFSIFTLLFILFPQRSFAHEYVPLEIVVNQQSYGESVVVLRNDGDVWISIDFIKSLKAMLPATAVVFEDKSYVSLRSLKSRLFFEVDIKKLVINITIQSLYLKPTRIDYAQTLAAQTTPVKNSAFLNYSILYRSSGEQDFNSWEAPFEGVVSVSGLVIKSNYFYRQLLDDTYWTRGMTSISRDFNQGMQRLVLGDYFVTSGDLGGSGVFSGISFSHNLSSNVMSYSNPGLNVSGLLETPSRVDVYANGMLVRTEELPAGPYNLENIPNVFGAGNASLVVTDAFGREKTFSQSYYVSSQLLQKGLSEYVYSLGWRRNQVDAVALEYDARPSILAYHKKGLTPNLTVGYRFDLDSDVWNVRPNIAFLPGKLGEFELLGAYSHYKKKNGYALSSRYTYVGRRFHFRASVNYLDPFFAHVSYKPESNVRHLTTNTSLGVHGHQLGSVSLVYARTSMLEDDVEQNSEVYSVLYNRRLTRTINLFVRAGQIRNDDGKENNLLFGLHAILGRKVSSSYAYSKTEEIYSNSLGFQKTAPLGKGFGFRGRVVKDNRIEESDDVDGDAYLSLKGDNGIVNASYFRSHDISSSQYSLSGALALIDSHIYLTRPIYDSFAVANVGNLDDVDVFLASEHMGNTTDGRLMIPNMSSYSPNRIKIDSEDLPVDISLRSTENIVVPVYRSGSLVTFPFERFQAINGTLKFDDFGVIRVPEFASLTLSNRNQSYESIVGKGGEFYYENTPTGKYTASLLYRGQTCQFVLEVPESNNVLIDLGEQTCAR